MLRKSGFPPGRFETKMNKDLVELIYRAPPRIAGWFPYMIGGILAMTLVPALVLLFIDIYAALAFLAVTAVDALLFWAVVPRRFEIYSNAVRVKLGGPFASNTPLENIENVRMVDGHSAFAYHGIKFTTTTRGVVEISRSKGMDLVVTPSDPETFLEQLDRVRQRPPAASRRS